MIVSDFKVTFGQLREMLNDVAEKEPDMDESMVLWAEVVQKGSIFQNDLKLFPGTLLLGLCQDEDDYGTLRIVPDVVKPVQ